MSIVFRHRMYRLFRLGSRGIYVTAGGCTRCSCTDWSAAEGPRSAEETDLTVLRMEVAVSLFGSPRSSRSAKSKMCKVSFASAWGIQLLALTYILSRTYCDHAARARFEDEVLDSLARPDRPGAFWHLLIPIHCDTARLGAYSQ